MEVLEKLIKNMCGKSSFEINPLKQAGSNRKYYRINCKNESFIGVINENISENRAFIHFSKHFKKNGVNVPEIYMVSDDERAYLQQDLGDKDLFDSLMENRKDYAGLNQNIYNLYLKSIEHIAYMQIVASRDLDYSFAYPSKVFAKRSMKYDLNYFKYYFIKTNGIEFNEQALQDDVEKLTSELELAGAKYFMFRDFQARNIMIKDSQVYFIDYQGGRKGPLQYDIASLLFQAKAALPEETRIKLYKHYLNCVSKHIKIDENKFTEQYFGFVLIRVLQTLGAYGFRGLIENKPHFIQSIPYALNNLKFLLDKTNALNDYPVLKDISKQILEIKAFQNNSKSTTEGLKISITSFSYKKGIPIDLSGNGGGFVFDCRGIFNPGRIKEYKDITGRDEAVIKFLEEKSEAQAFVKNAYEMVKPTILNYKDRQFTDLMINFGCTGGQHRSVYCADSLAKKLSTIRGVTVYLWHREQDIREHYNY